MKPKPWVLCAGIAAGLAGWLAAGGARAAEIVRFSNLGDQDLESEAFRLTRPLTVHVTCEGAGDGDADEMYAYGWILDADSREVVWALSPSTARASGSRFSFDGDLPLAAGDYLAYYAAYGSWRDQQRVIKIFGHKVGQIEIHSGRRRHRSRLASDRWGLNIETRSEGDEAAVQRLEARADRDRRAIVEIVGRRDNDFEQKAFSLPQRLQVTVYCQGEFDESDENMADYGWILDAETRKRVWEMGPDNFKHAGGAAKNKVSRETIALPAGSYVVSYTCDGSHSPEAWNAPPPYDPDLWGVTLWAGSELEALRVEPYRDDEAARTFVALLRQGDDAYAAQGFTLERRTKLRVYCLGEYDEGHESFADHGWIEEFAGHRQVWTMSADNVRPAGGARKNRLADDIVELPPGDYVARYTSDDSHSYRDWNQPPPHDPTHWGISIALVGRDADPRQVKLFDAEERAETGRERLVRMVRVGDDRHVKHRFRLERPVRLRVLCLGEGLQQEMFDYGWIEDAGSGAVVWEMTARNSRHAGGARKNRIFDGVIRLERGEYVAHYLTDGSHAWGDWNDTPPPEPYLWGLTVMFALDLEKDSN